MNGSPVLRETKGLMDADQLNRTLARMARELAARHPALAEVVLVGVQTRGVPLARRLARLACSGGVPPTVGSLDITLYRDDLTTIAAQPLIKGTDIPVSIDGRTVVLVDDVLYTGRTVRAALDELIDFGRPARIELAVLVDRGHRELPIRPDYVGAETTTTKDEIVQVELEEQDGRDRVVLCERQEPAPPASCDPQPASSAPARGRARCARRSRKRGQTAPRKPPSAGLRAARKRARAGRRGGRGRS